MVKGAHDVDRYNAVTNISAPKRTEYNHFSDIVCCTCWARKFTNQNWSIQISATTATLHKKQGDKLSAFIFCPWQVFFSLPVIVLCKIFISACLPIHFHYPLYIFSLLYHNFAETFKRIFPMNVFYRMPILSLI